MSNELVVPDTWIEKWQADFASGKDAGIDLKNVKKYFSKAEQEKILKTIDNRPYDLRFPQEKKQRMCWVYYIDYHRCLELKGEDWQPCKWFKNVYQDVCPSSWTDNWDSWVEEGRFPAKFDR